MRRHAAFCAVGLVLACGGIRAFAANPFGHSSPSYAAPGCASPGCATPSAPLPPGTAPGTAPGTMPGMPPGAAAQPPATDAFAQAPPAGGESAASALPNMIGDLGIYGSALNFVTTTKTIVVPTQVTQTILTPNPFFPSGPQFFTSTVTSLVDVTKTVKSQRAVRVPIAGRGAFKISENESPRPQDRVFLGYNYFANVSTPGINQFDIHRETFGFEKALLDGNASFGLRVPIIQQGGSFGMDDIGDISFVLKYALYNDRQSGNLFSSGIVVTAPTGSAIELGDGTTLHSTILQPYIGYIYNADRLYVHGFTAVVVPTDSRDVTFLSNDTGVGYRLSDMFVPTFETHINVAFNHQGQDKAPIGFSDSVILTSGLHTLLGRSTLTVGVAVPVVGPRQFDVEAVAQFNFRF